MFDWLRKLLGRKPKKREALERPLTKPTTKPIKFIPPCTRTIRVPRAGSKVRTDLDRHMKGHGRQSREYRASVKRKRQPKDDEF